MERKEKLDIDVYCIFRIKSKDEEPILWKIFMTQEKACGWIKEFSKNSEFKDSIFIWEKWTAKN